MALCDVRVEHLNGHGELIKAKSGKALKVEAYLSEVEGLPVLDIPLKPYVWANRLKEGHMTIRTPTPMNGHYQIMLSNALPYELQQLCDDMRAILSANCGPRPGPTERKRSQQDKENENRTHGKKSKTEIEQGRVPLGNHHKPEKNVEEAHLTSGQHKVLQVVRAGHSIFFTGRFSDNMRDKVVKRSAGTGKSYVLNKIVKMLPSSSTFVTATTGLAACHINGITLNSFAGIGRGQGSAKELLEFAGKGPAADRWRRCKTLIIDEVSMMDGDLFDKLEYIAQQVRGSPRPFGGIQLVLTGDFHQLPPVCKGRVSKFAFEARTWTKCVKNLVEMKEVMRQREGPFVDILNKIRKGSCEKDDLDQLKSMCAKSWDCFDDGILPTKLHTHRNDCDHANAKHLEELSGEMVMFKASEDRGTGRPGALASLKASCPAREVLQLKGKAPP